MSVSLLLFQGSFLGFLWINVIYRQHFLEFAGCLRRNLSKDGLFQVLMIMVGQSKGNQGLQSLFATTNFLFLRNES